LKVPQPTFRESAGCTFGAGIVGPSALTEALSVKAHVVGSAAGLYGFTQLAVGAICSALAGIGTNRALAPALVLAAAGLAGQGAFWIAIRVSRCNVVAPSFLLMRRSVAKDGSMAAH
jgi:hypothetical protein